MLENKVISLINNISNNYNKEVIMSKISSIVSFLETAQNWGNTVVRLGLGGLSTIVVKTAALVEHSVKLAGPAVEGAEHASKVVNVVNHVGAGVSVVGTGFSILNVLTNMENALNPFRDKGTVARTEHLGGALGHTALAVGGTFGFLGFLGLLASVPVLVVSGVGMGCAAAASAAFVATNAIGLGNDALELRRLYKFEKALEDSKATIHTMGKAFDTFLGKIKIEDNAGDWDGKVDKNDIQKYLRSRGAGWWKARCFAKRYKNASGGAKQTVETQFSEYLKEKKTKKLMKHFRVLDSAEAEHIIDIFSGVATNRNSDKNSALKEIKTLKEKIITKNIISRGLAALTITIGLVATGILLFAAPVAPAIFVPIGCSLVIVAATLGLVKLTYDHWSKITWLFKTVVGLPKSLTSCFRKRNVEVIRND